MNSLRHMSDTLTWERRNGGKVFCVYTLLKNHFLWAFAYLLILVLLLCIHISSLLDVLPEMSNLKVPAELDELPDDITLAQTVALWKYIVEFQSRQKQD